MPQTLYRFGFDPDQPTTELSTPRSIVTATRIEILWASWCDLIYTTNDSNGARSIHYSGTGLNDSQKEEFTKTDSKIVQSLQDPQCNLSFFGSVMHNGVQGYILRTEHTSTITIFSTMTEPDTTTWTLSDNCTTDIKICSDNSVIVATKSGQDEKDGLLCSAKSLRDFLNTPNNNQTLASFLPTHLITNATTATALSDDGKVHTRTTDPRYSPCLGRTYTGTYVFEPVPYLSETRVVKIASGGYMTAAISDDGELFLWGQANPGADGELGVLRGLHYGSGGDAGDVAIWADMEQDDYVKCLNSRIDGDEAVAYDIAIGFGHILVAIETASSNYAVLAAGCGSEGQLGLRERVDMLDNFREVTTLRGKRVVQLVAAGWSSYVIREN